MHVVGDSADSTSAEHRTVSKSSSFLRASGSQTVATSASASSAAARIDEWNERVAAATRSNGADRMPTAAPRSTRAKAIFCVRAATPSTSSMRAASMWRMRPPLARLLRRLSDRPMVPPNLPPSLRPGRMTEPDRPRASAEERMRRAHEEGITSYRALQAVRASLDDKDLPDDIRLPQPADLLDRASAAAIDLAVASAGGGLVWAALSALGLDTGTVASGTVGVTVALFVLRDCWWEEGTRSLGKAAMGLEVALFDGKLASPAQSAIRNAPFLLLPFIEIHPLVQSAALFLVAFDATAMLFTPAGRRAGDWLAQTRVVTSLPGREFRVLDLIEREELAVVEDAVAAIDPKEAQRLKEGDDDDPIPISELAAAGNDPKLLPHSRLLKQRARRLQGPSIVLPGMLLARRQGVLAERKRRVQAIADSIGAAPSTPSEADATNPTIAGLLTDVVAPPDSHQPSPPPPPPTATTAAEPADVPSTSTGQSARQS